MRVPDKVRDCVVFVGRNVSAGSEENKRLRGTAFIVSVPSKAFPNDVSFLYLVTARHVAQQLSLGPWFVRVNLRPEGIGEANVERSDDWYYHPTEADAVDVAVHPVVLPDETAYSAIPVSMFATEDCIEQSNLSTGDMIFFTGLFTKLNGKRRNMPLVRMGNVAMLPTEKIPISTDKGMTDSDVYLVEARSFGGFSGSPVFVRETAHLTATMGEGKDKKNVQVQSPGRFFFLGLMHGHWDIKKEDFNEIEFSTPRKGEEAINMGIAIVVPAKKILEILYQPELVERKRKRDQERRERTCGTTPD